MGDFRSDSKDVGVVRVRVGIPQGLLHFQYGAVMERFLAELGAEVVLSGETSRHTLDCGSVLDEVCLPAKVFSGMPAICATRSIIYFCRGLSASDRDNILVRKLLACRIC